MFLLHAAVTSLHVHIGVLYVLMMYAETSPCSELLAYALSKHTRNQQRATACTMVPDHSTWP